MNECDADLRWMKRALELAARGGRRVLPNPRVGALLVRDGRVLGEGWHRGPGTAHAERDALGNCSEDPAASTLYVSLEPCHLEGRTPPCTEAILSAGIARVVYALKDPNPAERGASHALLASAGVAVTGGILADEALALNEAYAHRQRTGRPFVLLKSASTLNGMLAHADGSSRWITGEAARREGHRLRAGACAVAVGGETARLDRPRLDSRLLEAGAPLPRPVVLDGDPLRCPVDLDWKGRDPLLLLPEGALDQAESHAAAGWRVLGLPPGESGGVCLDAALKALAEEGVSCLLVEGGGRLLSAFLGGGLWQRWEFFVAARLLAASGRPVWTLGQDSPPFRIDRIGMQGEDLQISLLPTAQEA